MPTVEFFDPSTGATLVVETDTPRLLDVCDESASPILFSCRSASCGVCRVEIVAGAELTLPASDDELETLDVFDAPASQRLACQVRLRTGPGRVRLVIVGDR